MRNSRGFALTAEAVLALLAALAVVLALPTMVSPPASQDLYSYQLAQDFLEVGVKNHPQEIAGFSEGDAIATSSLQSDYAKMVSKLGRYCLVMRANGNAFYAGCAPENAAGFTRQMVGHRTLLDSRGGWFELEAVLKY